MLVQFTAGSSNSRSPNVSSTARIAAKPRRHWLRFSLWTLMVSVLIVSVPLAWLARE
jgi:hypothetical protein